RDQHLVSDQQHLDVDQYESQHLPPSRALSDNNSFSSRLSQVVSLLIFFLDRNKQLFDFHLIMELSQHAFQLLLNPINALETSLINVGQTYKLHLHRLTP